MTNPHSFSEHDYQRSQALMVASRALVTALGVNRSRFRIRCVYMTEGRLSDILRPGPTRTLDLSNGGSMPRDLSTKTIRDFGQQWTIYRDNEGFYGSTALLADIFGPLLSLDSLRGIRVAEIGSGTGRIVKMLLELGVDHVTAVEPSDAFTVLCENVGSSDKLRCLRATGDQIPQDGNFDFVLSIGVLHHIPDTAPVIDAAFSALRPGGRLLIWVYGKEGNQLYLRLINPLRLLTSRLPHFLLVMIVRILDVILLLYRKLCCIWRLPLRDYMPIIANLSPDKCRLVIYDQLKPSFAKYYTREEAEGLLKRQFTDVKLFHRRGYSWTVIGTKPMAKDDTR